MNRLGLFVLVSLAAFAPAACGEDPDSTGSGTSTATSGGGPSGCTDPTAVPCEDDVILQMDLKTNVAAGQTTSTPDGAGFLSTVDATAGGAFMVTDSYTYARFTATGLEKVAISDEDALASMDWDIAFRRYVVRINSGHSGPSCVTAARIPPGPTFADITAVPGGLTFRKDEYFTDTCELVPDGTGLMGSPATALSSYWTYPGCVQMTFNVYIVSLADQTKVKLLVERFYNEAAQAQCQTQGTIPMTNNGSGNFLVRWALL